MHMAIQQRGNRYRVKIFDKDSRNPVGSKSFKTHAEAKEWEKQEYARLTLSHLVPTPSGAGIALHELTKPVLVDRDEARLFRDRQKTD
jgi:hypothetical protein